jgi:glycosyltransferase involved in cell wall biosynthesis
VSNHNYGPYLAEMLDALLAQTYEHVEVVVVDDGSTDDSRDVLARYGDRILVQHQENRGQAVACNRAFARSSGEIVVFHDSDDIAHPHAAATLVEAFADPEVMLVMSRLEVIDGDGRPTGAWRPPEGTRFEGGDLRSLVLKHCTFVWPETTGQAYRRSLIEAVAPIPELTPPDAYYSHFGALAGPVVALHDPIARYRVHGRNKSLVPGLYGTAWLDEWIQERGTLHEEMRRFGLSVGLFRNGAAAAEWVPRDVIMAGLRAARCRLRGDPGRWRYAWEGLRAIVGHRQFRLRSRARHIAWFGATAVLPRDAARRVIVSRYPHAQ